MKKQSLRIAVTVSLFALLCAGVQAQTTNSPVKFHVPFDFNIGQQTLPAGDYLVSYASRDTDSPAVIIRSRAGSASRVLQMTPVGAGKSRRSARLVFNRYGERYFLSQVWTTAERAGLKVRRSRAERTVEVAGNAPRASVEVAAGR